MVLSKAMRLYLHCCQPGVKEIRAASVNRDSQYTVGKERVWKLIYLHFCQPVLGIVFVVIPSLLIVFKSKVY